MLCSTCSLGAKGSVPGSGDLEGSKAQTHTHLRNYKQLVRKKRVGLVANNSYIILL